MIKKQQQQPNKSKRLYQLWHKSNRFYCYGKLVTGPKTDFPISIAPYIVFIIVIALYSYFIMVDMLQYNIILCISFFISFTATITFMLLTSYSDPSIIPQRPFLLLQQRQLQQQNNLQQNNNNNQHLLNDQPQYQRLQYLLYQCSDPQQIFCQTCHIYRPQSTSHCRQCDNCILQMDHHCPWLNTCVGRNNYKWFILFIMSLVGMMVVFCCNVLVWMDGVVIGKGARNGGYGERVRDIDGRENNNLISNNRDDNNRDDNNNDVMLNVYITMCFIIVGALILVILAFCMFHLFLLCKGKTTRQFIKQSRKKKKNKNKLSFSRQQKIRSQQQSLLNEQQQQHITDRLISVEDAQIAVDYQGQQKQNQKINRNSIKIENNNINKRLQSSHLLDNYIQSHYRQPKTFYKQLFKPSSILQNIHFVNFRKEITLQQEEFLLKEFDQMKQKRRELKENGKLTVYYKMLENNGGSSIITM